MKDKRGIGVLALAATLVLALAASGCDGFFQSSNDVASITVSPGATLLAPCSAGSGSCTQALTVVATLVNGNSSTVTSSATYSSSNTSVVTVDTSGTVTAVGSGTATVTVKYQGKTASPTFLITATPITSITASPSIVTLSITGGSTVQLVAKAQDGTDITKYVTWSTANSNLVTVNYNNTAGLIASAGLTTVTTSTSTTVTATLSSSATNNTTVTSNTVTVNLTT